MKPPSIKSGGFLYDKQSYMIMNQEIGSLSIHVIVTVYMIRKEINTKGYETGSPK